MWIYSNMAKSKTRLLTLYAIYFILLAFLHLSRKKKKEQLGNYMEHSFACITQRRLRRDYPEPDVSLSKEKTRSPLRSSNILPLVSVKQQGVDGRLSGASCRLSLNLQDFRFRKQSSFNVVDTSSIIL